MDMPLTDTILVHQRQAEWLFAAAVYLNDDTAKSQCGWLLPEKIQDITIRSYWQKVLGGMESSKAALECGIFYKLTEYMTAETFSTRYIGSFADTIADDTYLVEMAEALKRLAGHISTRNIPEVQRILGDAAKNKPGSHVEGAQAVEASLDFMDTLDDAPNVIKTGLPKIDNTFGGFSLQTLNILAARPSMGKTAIALQFARACVDNGGIALYFSVEMSRKALWSRMVCGEARVDHRKYKARTWTADERERCVFANNSLVADYGQSLIIDDRSIVTTADIWKAAAQYKPDLLIVDHLALLSDKHTNNVLRVGAIAWGGKQIAKEFNCASLYLCQLNRAVEAREVKIPNMADLRDSGEIEQDADTVFFIHRADYYTQADKVINPSPTDLVLAKDRAGVRNVNYKLQYELIRQKFFETAMEANP